MASYSIVLAPMAAILAADYFLVKRRMIDIPALYDPNGRYRFYKGWNWRAFVALLLAIAPNLPGMINAIQPNIAIGNIRYIYMVSNIWGATSKCAKLWCYRLTVHSWCGYAVPAVMAVSGQRSTHRGTYLGP